MRYMNALEHSNRYFDALLAQLDRALDFYIPMLEAHPKVAGSTPRRARAFFGLLFGCALRRE